jgi:poly(hydroxyalkanoate) granule-associated protein
MVKKLKELAEGAGGTGNPLAQQVKESAQQIWLAGLGAFGKTQAEGQKVFQALVQEGMSLQKRSRSMMGGEKVAEMGKMAGKMAGQASGKANAAWDKLEQVFEDRVARALGRLGVPTKADLDDLARRVDALNASVKALASRPRKPRKAGTTGA